MRPNGPPARVQKTETDRPLGEQSTTLLGAEVSKASRTVDTTAWPGRRRTRALGVLALAVVGVVLAACSSTTSGPGGGGSGGAGAKLILVELSFPCGLNDYAKQLCAGATAAGKTLPKGYKVEIKTGINYGDVTAYNSLIETSLQLNPAGLIVFPNGPAAQTLVLNQACDKGVKVVIMDSPATGVKCQSSFVGANHYQLGVEDGKWLIAHPPSSKEVGVVTLQPGEYQSNDDRVKGFTQTVQAAGYRLVATVVTDNSLAKTRTEVTNMITAHPNLGAVFSANSPMAQGTKQALLSNHRIMQLTLDGALTDVPSILDGTISADAAQDPYAQGTLAVQYIARAIQGQQVPSKTYTPLQVVDKTNAQAYLQAGGLR
jgi:ribose transport system substrate-binding protein